MTDGFDVIGDIHGEAGALERLLGALGYAEVDGCFVHPTRQAVFLGDLVDRGAGQVRVLEIVRAMVDRGRARIVMGNHEFNAIAWATPDGQGGHHRPHTTKNRTQHAAFLDQIGEDSVAHREAVAWFRTMPMWLDLGGLRVVHACWDPGSMAVLGGSTLTPAMVTAPAGSPAYEAIEVLLKGPEIDLGGRCYLDKDGNERRRARRRWWDPSATTLAAAAEIPPRVTACDGGEFVPLPDTPVAPLGAPVGGSDGPVLFGHYWRSGPTPTVDGPTSACLDWSIAKGGHLVAYRWSGERSLTDANLVAVR
jgi:hypothetical protein